LRSLMNGQNEQGQGSSVSESISAPFMAPLMLPTSEAFSSPANSPDTRPQPAAPPAMATPATPENSTSVVPDANCPETWQDPSVFLDSFFTSDDRPGSASESESPPEWVDWPPVAGSSDPADGAVVSNDEADVRWRRAPVRLAGGR